MQSDRYYPIMDKTNNEKDNENILHYDLLKENKENLTIDYRNSNYKEVQISLPKISSKPIIIKQDFTLGKGGILWDGSYFITKFINDHIITNHQIKSIIELGAGTSLPSLSLLYNGYSVTTTDIPKLIPFINSIINLNKQNFPKESISKVMQLSWEKKEDIDNVKQSNNNKPFDLIIASELIYLDDLFDDLINVFIELSDEKSYILLSYKIRLPSMVTDFLNRVQKYFRIEYIKYDLKEQIYPLPEKLVLMRLHKIK